jgi:dihydrofolate reductase
VISIIAAMDSKRGIGKNNTIPWHIPEDFKRLKEITTNHPIIMGRKTYESLGKPLPDRTNIIISRNPARYHQLVEEALKIAKKSDGNEEIFIFGGGQIFQEALEKGIVDKLYLTIIEGQYDSDTFFPDYSGFEKISEESHDSGKYKFKFVNLEKN